VVVGEEGFVVDEPPAVVVVVVAVPPAVLDALDPSSLEHAAATRHDAAITAHAIH
jgi:hypothetical protein